MENRRRVYKKQKRKKRKRRILFWLFVPVFLLFLGIVGYGTFLIHKAESVANKSFEEIRDESKRPNPKSENISILFIGVDDSKTRKFKDSTRADALILATFNSKDKSVKMVSIPRDSYVYIPSEDKYDKITHSHAYGGVKGTVETVENLFDIRIDYYVKMNFYAFIDVVDALGGIEVEVPYDIKEKDSEDRKTIVLKEGLQTLDGEEALALARTRKKDNDIERGKRQQQIIKAIVKKASNVGSITKYDDILEAVGENMKTNLTFDEMKSFINYATAGKKLKIESLQLQGEDNYGGAYYFELDEESVEEVSLALKNHLNPTAATADTSDITDTSDTAETDESTQEDSSQ
jgi:polyisoprenyl-teichoic acid--peptidoglycan teichoic acid transferase